jgi:hypothetical protein
MAAIPNYGITVTVLDCHRDSATRLRCRLICAARNSNLAALYAAKQHDGQITQNLSRPLAKNISLSLSGKSMV